MRAPNEIRDEELVREYHVPLVITGLSGSGKDTTSARAKELAEQYEHPGIWMRHYHGRLTTRQARPGEVEGKDGTFGVPPDVFDARAQDMIYHYLKYETRYGFDRRALEECLADRNTFMIGGEPDTAAALSAAVLREHPRARHESPILRPASIYIHRPLEEIVEGIEGRPAPPAERQKRIAHVRQAYREKPDGAFDYIIHNGHHRLEEASTELVFVVRGELEKQLRELFGSSFRLPATGLRRRRGAAVVSSLQE